VTEMKIRIEKHSKWIDSGDELLVLSSAADFPLWGKFGKDALAINEISGHVDALEVNDGRFIFLGVRQFPISIVCCDMGLMFLRREQELESSGLNVFESLKAVKLAAVELLNVAHVKLTRGKYLLFDASLSAQKTYEINLDQDVPFATTFRYAPHDEISFVMHNFFYRN